MIRLGLAGDASDRLFAWVFDERNSGISTQSHSIGPKNYDFYKVETCNMCGHDASDARVLGVRLNRSQGVHPRGKTGIGVSVCRCRKCGLNFPQPMPVPKSLSDHYGLPPESYWTHAEYFKIDPTYFSRQLEDAKRLLSFKPGMKALDIGVGIGKGVIAMKSAGFDVWGIEPSKPFMDKAMELTGLATDRLQNVPIEEAEFEENFFDFVSFGAVLEHLYDPSESIRKSLRWLVPGGVIQIEVPSSNHLMPRFLNTYFRLRGTNYVTNLSPMHPPFHIYEFTPQSFEMNGDKIGYEIAHQYIEVASIRHVPRFLHPMLRFVMKSTKTGMQLTVWLRKPN